MATEKSFYLVNVVKYAFTVGGHGNFCTVPRCGLIQYELSLSTH